MTRKANNIFRVYWYKGRPCYAARCRPFLRSNERNNGNSKLSVFQRSTFTHS
jgi:hypothetical protein